MPAQYGCSRVEDLYAELGYGKWSARQVLAKASGQMLPELPPQDKHPKLPTSVKRMLGMDAETITRCLEPFYTTKSEFGTGLGLWVSHAIVQKHEGSIRVRSRAASGSSGTVFSIFLPDSAGRVQDDLSSNQSTEWMRS